jgi:hypothetical protein
MILLLERLLCFNLTFHILLSGILFTMLVFGPACGFILGSFCTKIYVDAVFIDTSKSWISTSNHPITLFVFSLLGSKPSYGCAIAIGKMDQLENPFYNSLS